MSSDAQTRARKRRMTFYSSTNDLASYPHPLKLRREPDEYFTTYDKVRERGVSLPKFKCLEKQD